LVTKIIRLNADSISQTSPSVTLIGNFDGLHKGHARLINKATELKRILPSSVTTLISFYPHPLKILRGQKIELLTPLRKKLEILSDLGLDQLALIRFSKKFSELSAPEFLKTYLIEKLNSKSLIIGADTKVGKSREGDANSIKSFLETFGVSVQIEKFEEVCNIKIGSASIREKILKGEISESSQLLGRPFTISGRVVRGDGRGKQIGTPTANVWSKNQLLPPNGVYAGMAKLNQKRYPAITNIGTRPTFGINDKRVVEVHILNYTGSGFYKKILEFAPSHFLRSEMRFSSVGELKNQIIKDIASAKSLLHA